MALEDEIINIEDLDIAKEIKIGDFVLLETTDGTKLIDFKDFIIGTDNITFYDKISGGDFLQTADISALSADVTTNTSILTGISGVNDDINGLRDYINALASDFAKFRASINELSDVTLETYTSTTVGFAVTRNSVGNPSPSKTISFSTLDFKGTGLTEASSGNGSVYLGTGTDGFQYIAKGSYNLYLIGSLTFRTTSTGDTLKIMKNDTVVQEINLPAGTSSRGYDQHAGVAALVRVVAGDKVTFVTNRSSRMTKGNINGTII